MINSGVDFVFCQKIIRKLARVWVHKLPENTMYNLDDLLSEGMEVFVKCCKDFDGTSKFTTYLCIMVRQRFTRIVRDEKRDKRMCINVTYLNVGFDEAEDIVSSNSAVTDETLYSLKVEKVYNYHDISPERLIMVHDAIKAIAEVSEDFADMIKNGVPKKLFSLAIRHMRSKKFKNNPVKTGNNIIFTKTMIKDFFGVDLKILKELVYNYL